MLTFTAKLNELDDDGLWLARRLHVDDDRRAAPVIQGSTVSIDKRCSLHLRSPLSVWERAEKFDGAGLLRTEPMSDAEHEKWRRQIEVYGDQDRQLFKFNPVRHLYEFGRRCIHCVRTAYETPGENAEQWVRQVCTHPNHPERLDALLPHPAAQINELGRIAKWWCELGCLEIVPPRPPSFRVKLVENALFGTSSDNANRLPVPDETDFGIQN